MLIFKIISSSSSQWWTRKRVGEYFPVFSRDHPPLLEYLVKMKIVQSKSTPKVTNTYLKLILDYLRLITSKIDASFLLWGIFTAGITIIMTRDYNQPAKKKNHRSKTQKEKHNDG